MKKVYPVGKIGLPQYLERLRQLTTDAAKASSLKKLELPSLKEIAKRDNHLWLFIRSYLDSGDASDFCVGLCLVAMAESKLSVLMISKKILNEMAAIYTGVANKCDESIYFRVQASLSAIGVWKLNENLEVRKARLFEIRNVELLKLLSANADGEKSLRNNNRIYRRKMKGKDLEDAKRVKTAKIDAPKLKRQSEKKLPHEIQFERERKALHRELDELAKTAKTTGELWYFERSKQREIDIRYLYADELENWRTNIVNPLLAVLNTGRYRQDLGPRLREAIATHARVGYSTPSKADYMSLVDELLKRRFCEDESKKPYMAYNGSECNFVRKIMIGVFNEEYEDRQFHCKVRETQNFEKFFDETLNFIMTMANELDKTDECVDLMRAFAEDFNLDCATAATLPEILASLKNGYTSNKLLIDMKVKFARALGKAYDTIYYHWGYLDLLEERMMNEPEGAL